MFFWFYKIDSLQGHSHEQAIWTNPIQILSSLKVTEKFSRLSRPKVERLDHYKVWLDAFHTEEDPNSYFGYAGPLTETVLMGVVAARIGGKEKLTSDAKKLCFTNSGQANSFVRPKYRKGWGIEGLG